jgi:murein DD-endopeptidase MepM/ murein hydrolase activator NlpD
MVLYARTAHADCGEREQSTPVVTPAFTIAPTSTSTFRLRPATGTYLAGRAKKAHEGVDIIATATSKDKAAFRVRASGGGKIAFVGNSDPKGYGLTVIIDHENGEYSLYAHLAEKASAQCVVLGDYVHEGDTVGFVYDPDTGETSSGNAKSNKGVELWERIQVHVELIEAPKGRSSKTNTKPIKTDAKITDPTSRLEKSGYSR